MILRIFAVLLITVSAAVYPDTGSTDLPETEKHGKTEKEYRTWLDNNTGAENFSNVLFSAVKASGNADTAIDLLTRYLPSIRSSESRVEAFNLLGEYYELTGDIKNAQSAYEHGADIAGDSTDYSLLLKSALMLQYMGEYKRSELQILRSLHRTGDSKTVETCYFLLARVYRLTGDKESYGEMVKEISESKQPEILYFLNKIPEKGYETSPENLLIKGEISLLPDVENAFGLLNLESVETSKEVFKGNRENKSETSGKKAEEEEDNIFFIQTGSFRNRDNAEYMCRDLEKLGFKTEISDQTISGNLYHKVYIKAKSAEEVPKLILKLKDAGYEGYPVY